MDLHELDERIDRLNIRKQLELLLKNLRESKDKLEISNLLWDRIVAAEGLLNDKETRLFDSAVDHLIEIRSLVGCRQPKQPER